MDNDQLDLPEDALLNLAKSAKSKRWNLCIICRASGDPYCAACQFLIDAGYHLTVANRPHEPAAPNVD